MVRVLATAGIVAFALALILLVENAGENAIPAVLLLLASVVISTLLAARRVVLMARTVVRDARAFFRGDVQSARLVGIEDPDGLFNPTSAAVFELEGEDGATYRFQRDIPIPFFTAWSYRAAKRLPFVRTVDQSKIRELVAFELRREGLDVSVSRPDPAPEPAA